MFGKYIIRLDDACPTMDVNKWRKIESLLDKYHIKPIVAVIPNNKDIDQIKGIKDNLFWIKVAQWQEKGWKIALHGYEHLYVTEESGLIKFNQRSEFAGLSYIEQVNKLSKAVKIFKSKNIFTDIWVAPSHTFDHNTLKALKKVTSIKIISDSISVFPYEEYGFNWIPQQFWYFRKMPFGVWTSCYHPNEMTDSEFRRLSSFIDKNYKDFIDIKDIKFYKKSILDKIFNFIYWQLRKVKYESKI